MNRNDFLQMMNESVPVNRQLIGEVYELIDIFPYFQSAHLLLLKGLQNTSDVKFENQLRNSAIHVADREVLYNLLKSKTLKDTPRPEILKERGRPAEVAFDNQQTVIESAKNSVDLINEIERESAENTNEERDDSSLSSVHSALITPESDSEQSSSVMLVIEDDFADTEEKIFFMDPGFSLPETFELLELDLDSENQSSFDNFSKEADTSAFAEDLSDKRLQSDLIDKFIIANPRIEPKREKSDLPVEDISKSFIEKEGGLVTETLARIYINQGYYSKAIDIYEKLSLKFPEKSSYFATQIEKVKEYIKN